MTTASPLLFPTASNFVLDFLEDSQTYVFTSTHSHTTSWDYKLDHYADQIPMTATATESHAETAEEMPLLVYNTVNTLEDHIVTYCANTKKDPSKKASYEPSPFSLAVANVAAPLYLYTSLKGKSDLWDKLLAKVPDDLLLSNPSLDTSCGRGLL
ncbi:methyltransferase [Penicillium brevicompactum]|uniref:methyltransferase n=1 Tax=Penicillium brevicompactum TaxID=5074 RepID=UPI00254196CF|nr:methyltransferase [Penicillium brevicompactum]KAJ5335834.1 methyltransferase [Penicillium brevicompactum]